MTRALFYLRITVELGVMLTQGRSGVRSNYVGNSAYMVLAHIVVSNVSVYSSRYPVAKKAMRVPKYTWGFSQIVMPENVSYLVSAGHCAWLAMSLTSFSRQNLLTFILRLYEFICTCLYGRSKLCNCDMTTANSSQA